MVHVLCTQGLGTTTSPSLASGRGRALHRRDGDTTSDSGAAEPNQENFLCFSSCIGLMDKI